jgi:hypothetical protein
VNTTSASSSKVLENYQSGAEMPPIIAGLVDKYGTIVRSANSAKLNVKVQN